MIHIPIVPAMLRTRRDAPLRLRQARIRHRTAPARRNGPPQPGPPGLHQSRGRLRRPPWEPTGGRRAPTGRRDATITRLAVLRAAAEFVASRPQLKSGEVLKIAGSWERWVTRDDGDDLIDAF